MKKYATLFIALIASSIASYAQDTPRTNSNEDAQEKLEQETTQRNQREIERAARQNAEKIEREKKLKETQAVVKKEVRIKKTKTK